MDETRDAILALGLTLTQPAAGHRVGADAVLLAAAAGPPAAKLVDVGAGVGAVGLALLKRWPQAHADLIEIAPELADLRAQKRARGGPRGARENRLPRRSRRQGAPRRWAGAGEADLVITNPPFYAAGRGARLP